MSNTFNTLYGIKENQQQTNNATDNGYSPILQSLYSVNVPTPPYLAENKTQESPFEPNHRYGLYDWLSDRNFNNVDQSRKAALLKEYRETVVPMIAETFGEDTEAAKQNFDAQLPMQIKGMTRPIERGWIEAANDNVVTAGNAVFGLAKSLSDVVDPDSGVSKWLGKTINEGNQSLSPYLKDQQLRRALDKADAKGDYGKELAADLDYYKRNISAGVAEVLGNVGAVAATAGVGGYAGGAVGLGALGARTAMWLTGIASGAGEIRGNIYDHIMNMPEDELRQSSSQYNVLLNYGYSPENARKTVATDLQKNWKEVAGGAALGALDAFGGAEKVLAGGVSKGLLKTMGSEAAQEAIQEGGGQLLSNVAIRRDDKKHDLFDSVVSNAGTGALLGAAGGGLVHSATSLGGQSGADQIVNATAQEVAQQQAAQDGSGLLAIPQAEPNQANQQSAANDINAEIEYIASNRATNEAEKQQIVSELSRAIQAGTVENLAQSSSLANNAAQDFLDRQAARANGTLVEQTQPAEQEQKIAETNKDMERVTNLFTRLQAWGNNKDKPVGKIDDLNPEKLKIPDDEKRAFAIEQAVNEIKTIASKYGVNPEDGEAIRQWVNGYIESQKARKAERNTQADNLAVQFVGVAQPKIEEEQEHNENADVQQQELEAQKIAETSKDMERVTNLFTRLQAWGNNKDKPVGKIDDLNPEKLKIPDDEKRAFAIEQAVNEIKTIASKYGIDPEDSTAIRQWIDDYTNKQQARKAERNKQADNIAAQLLNTPNKVQPVKTDTAEKQSSTNEVIDEQSSTTSQIPVENSTGSVNTTEGDEQRTIERTGQRTPQQIETGRPSENRQSERQPEPVNQDEQPSSNDEGFSFEEEISGEEQDKLNHVNEIKQSVIDAVGEENAQHIEILTQEEAERPDGVQSLNLDGVEGYYNPKTGVITLIADNLTKDTAGFVAWHELGHRGIDSHVFRRYKALIKRSGDNATVNELANKIVEARKGTGDPAENNRLIAIEEAIVELLAAKNTGNWSHLESKYGITIPVEFKRKQPSLLTRIMRQLREIFSIVKGRRAVSNEEVINLLKMVNVSIKTGGKGKTDGKRFSLNESPDSDFAKAVDEVAKGNKVSGYIKLGTTPDVMQMLGFPVVAVEITQEVLYKAMLDKHGVSKVVLKQIPKELNNPVAVMKSKTKSNGYVLLTEFTEKKNGIDKPVIAALHFKEIGKNIQVFNIASIYGRSHSQINTGLNEYLLYINREKGSKLLKRLALRLRSGLASDVSSLLKSNVKTDSDLRQYISDKKAGKGKNTTPPVKFSRVKPLGTSFEDAEKSLGGRPAYEKAKNEGKTELSYENWVLVRTPAFRRWFGNWERHPEQSSKVINPRTGEPLVVFHGTKEEFDTFEQGHQGFDPVASDAFFFADVEDIAEGYSESTGNVIPTFISAKKPFSFYDETNLNELNNAIEHDDLRSPVYGEKIPTFGTGENIWESIVEKIHPLARNDVLNGILNWAKSEGYDGVIMSDAFRDSDEYTSYAVFEPNQIKSATDNNGEFNADNANIYYSRKAKETTSTDAEYLKLAKQYEAGDKSVEGRLKELIQQQADKNGFDSDVSFRMNHRAPYRDEENYNKSADDVSEIFGDDIYGRHAVEYFGHGDPAMDRESIRVIQSVHGQPEADITVYRAVPKSLKGTGIANGDWVTTSLTYAKQHGEAHLDGDYKVVKKVVKAKDLFTDGNSIHEWGYDNGRDTLRSKTHDREKLADLITYDDEGNIIPLSKRFNNRSKDIRFSRSKNTSEKSYDDNDYIELYHGSKFKERPVIVSGAKARLNDYPFDGIFASNKKDASESHGEYLHKYLIHEKSIASTKDLNNYTDTVKKALIKETNTDDEEKLEEIFNLAVWHDDEYIDESYLEQRGLTVDDINPRADIDYGGISREFQRLRGVIAKALGFKAVEMNDEHGTSYYILEDSNEGYDVTGQKYSRKRDSNTPLVDKTPTVREIARTMTDSSAREAIKSFFTEGGKAVQPKWLETLTTLVFDDKAPITNILRRFKTDSAKALEFSLRTFQAATQKTTDMFLKAHYDPMMETLKSAWQKDFKKLYKDFGNDGWKQFLMDIGTVGNLVKHGRERNAEILRKTEGRDKAGSGRTDEEINVIEQTFKEQVPGLIEFYEDLYKKHLKPMLDYRDKTLLDAGLLTQEMIDARADYEWYVPLYGNPKEDGNNGFFYSPAPEIRDIKDKKAKGRSGTLADNVLQNVMTATQTAIKRAGQQTLLYRLFDFVDKNPAGRNLMQAKVNTPDKKEIFEKYVDKDGIVQERVKPSAALDKDAIVFRNGNTVQVMKIGNKRILEALQGLNKAQIEGLFAVPQKATRLLSAVYTRYNPMFPVMNKIRDTMSQLSFILADAPVRNPVKVAMKVLAYNSKFSSQWRKNPNSDYQKWLERYQRAGGATMYIDVFRDDVMRNISEDFAKGVGATGKHQMKSMMNAISKIVDGINEHFEMSSRVAVFKGLVEGGMSEQDALLYTKNLMNFETRGKYGQQMGAIYSFANAALFDARRMMQSLRTPRGAMVMAAHIGVMYSLYGALKALGGDDEDGIARLNKNPLTSSGRFLIFIDPTDPEGKGYKIPVGFGFGRISLTIAAAMHRLQDGVDSKEEFLENVLKEALVANLSPLEPIDISPSQDTAKWLAQQFAPTVLRPVIQLSQNTTGQGAPIHMPDEWIGEGLKFEKSYPNTNQIWRDIAKFVYDKTGYDSSPETYRFLTQSYFGSGGTEVSRGLMLLNEKVGTELSLGDIPLGQAFAHKGDRYDLTSYMKRKQQVKRLKAEREYEYENGRGDEFDLLHPGVEYLSQLFKETDKEIKKLQKERKTYDEIQDPLEKQRKIKEITQKMRMLYMSANKAVRDYDESQKQLNF